MILIYSKKSIHKWKFWTSKSKILYCLVSGLSFTLIYFLSVLTFKLISGNTNNLIISSLNMSVGAFCASTFLSIAHWYENERKYKEWLNNNSSQN